MTPVAADAFGLFELAAPNPALLSMMNTLLKANGYIKVATPFVVFIDPHCTTNYDFPIVNQYAPSPSIAVFPFVELLIKIFIDELETTTAPINANRISTDVAIYVA